MTLDSRRTEYLLEGAYNTLHCTNSKNEMLIARLYQLMSSQRTERKQSKSRITSRVYMRANRSRYDDLFLFGEAFDNRGGNLEEVGDDLPRREREPGVIVRH